MPLRLGSAYCRSILCLLAAERPLDLRNGAEVELVNGALKQANSRQFHHLFPKAYMRGRPGAENVNSVANIAFIPADLNLKIGKQAPSKYLARLEWKSTRWHNKLKSHGITTTTARLLQSNDYLGFLSARSKWIARRADRVIRNR